MQCLSSFSTLLCLFMSVNACVVASNILGPSQVLEFMGIQLDSTRMEARLPEDKLLHTRELLNSFAECRSVRLLELQSLIGTLQFVVPGRTFLQRMIDLTSSVRNRFHHIRLNKEFFKDLNMWKAFLAGWNGHSFFLDSTITPSPDMDLYSDAFGTIGIGGYFKGKWFQGRWPPHMQLNKDRGISIEWQELFPIIVAPVICFPYFSGKLIQFWCDNQSVVAILNSGCSKAASIMDLYGSLSFYLWSIPFCHCPPCPGGFQWDCWCALVLLGFSFPGSCSYSGTNPLHHPAFAHDPLKDEVLMYANWGLVWSTNRTYVTGEKQCIQFCLMNRLISSEGDILPASEGTLSHFTSYLARKGKHSTVKLYLAAVRNLHISHGHGVNYYYKKFFVVFSASRVTPVSYAGWSCQRFYSLIRPILCSWLRELDFCMIWAAFTLVFFCFLCCSEFTYPGVSTFRPQSDLTANCVSFHPSLASPKQMSFQVFWDRRFSGGSPVIHHMFTLSGQCSFCHVFLFFNFMPSGSIIFISVNAARFAGLPYNSLKGHSFHIRAELSKAHEVTIVYTLARCWPEVSSWCRLELGL